MLKGNPLQLSPVKSSDFHGILQVRSAFARSRRECLGHDVDLPILLQGDVFEIRVEGHRQRSRQGPGRGGPDDGVTVFPASRASIAAGSLVSR